MSAPKILLPLLSLMLLPSCASVISGTSQDIAINTTPEGAKCVLIREGKVVARVSETPETVHIQKTKHDVTIECEKKGYEKSTFINQSGSEGATFGNIILGGGIGWAVDSARGADNKYQDNVHINLSR